MIAPYFFELLNSCLLEFAVFHFLFLLLVDLILPSHSLLLLLFLLAVKHGDFLRVNEGLRYDFFFIVKVGPFPIIGQFWFIALLIQYTFQCLKLSDVVFREANEDVLRPDVGQSFIQAPSVLAHKKGTKHNQTSIVAIGRKNNAAQRLFLCLLDELLQLL